MKRREFLSQSGYACIAVGIFGKISGIPGRYIGDTPTTTDILGPFYRPGAPIRTNINPTGYTGQTFHFSGTVYKGDGITPYENCRVEVWQCDENRLYDNTSDDYRYRGTQLTGKDGKYNFITCRPVPYQSPEDPAVWRPAHIHMLVSGNGQQDLITQVYLKGDPYLAKDRSSSSPLAINRILNIQKNDKNEESLVFDIVMSKEFKPDDNVFEKLSGIYSMDDKSLIEFYRKDDLLFLKWGGQFREGLSYKGNNEFTGGVNNRTSARFEIKPGGEVRVKVNFYRPRLNSTTSLEGIKAFKYE